METKTQPDTAPALKAIDILNRLLQEEIARFEFTDPAVAVELLRIKLYCNLQFHKRREEREASNVVSLL